MALYKSHFYLQPKMRKFQIYEDCVDEEYIDGQQNDENMIEKMYEEIPGEKNLRFTYQDRKSASATNTRLVRSRSDLTSRAHGAHDLMLNE